MKGLIKWAGEIAGFLFGWLIPFVFILAGGFIFIRFFPNHALLLTAVWTVAVIIIDIRYSKWY